jgi:hypothetical protein
VIKKPSIVERLLTTRRDDAVDVTKLEYPALRQLVIAWNDGATLEERKRSRQIAELAQFEIEIRFKVDARMYDGRGPEPIPPLPAPWLKPRPARCVDWQRPTGSKLYPSPEDEARSRLAALARDIYSSK